MKKVTTVYQARLLPEIDDPYFERSSRIDPVTHHTIIEQVARPFSAAPIDGDSILLFIDSDGRRMQVVYTNEGPAKIMLRIP